MIRKAKKRLHGSAEIELRPDGWERFKTAVAAAAKCGPKHRPGKHKPEESEAKKPDKSE
jgi:hypothetical protein